MANMVADIECQTKNLDQLEVEAIFKRAKYPVTLKFEDVVYKIKIKKGGSCVKKTKTEEKVILNGMTGMVNPGEMLAMLGPSGSGKTTLLTALGGRLGGINGNITYNGKPFSDPIKRNTGFVTQDDVLYAHLTVTETLVFTALLRLPNSLTEEEKIAHAEAVITQLGLTKCKNNIIGGPLLRGISGGERKRVSIGQEILINPSLMFLDEPTSGLDSTTAQQIVSALWRLANGGRTIVMTIHQPSSRLFYMFSKVMLLSEGNTLYFGEASSVMDYFANIGYCPSVSMNPSDFLLDLANGVPSDCESAEEKQALMVKQTLVSHYKKTLAGKLKAELQENDIRLLDGSEERQYRRWSTTWWQQCIVLFRRGIKERAQDSFYDPMKHLPVLCAAFLSALLWWKSDISHIQDQIGLLFFYAQFWTYVSVSQAVYAFPQERLMLEKERSSGMYKLSAYFMSRILGDLPTELALPTIYVTLTYWMGGLKSTPGNFLHTLFVLLYSVLVSQGLGLALGAVVLDTKEASKLGATIVLLFVLAGGYFVQDVPSFIGWTKYFSITHHTYKLLVGSQYKPSDTYPCRTPQGFCLVKEYPAIKKLGLDGQVISVVAMAIMLVGYRLVAYVALLRIGATRK